MSMKNFKQNCLLIRWVLLAVLLLGGVRASAQTYPVDVTVELVSFRLFANGDGLGGDPDPHVVFNGICYSYEEIPDGNDVVFPSAGVDALVVQSGSFCPTSVAGGIPTYAPLTITVPADFEAQEDDNGGACVCETSLLNDDDGCITAADVPPVIFNIPSVATPGVYSVSVPAIVDATGTGVTWVAFDYKITIIPDVNAGPCAGTCTASGIDPSGTFETQQGTGPVIDLGLAPAAINIPLTLVGDVDNVAITFTVNYNDNAGGCGTASNGFNFSFTDIGDVILTSPNGSPVTLFGSYGVFGVGTGSLNVTYTFVADPNGPLTFVNPLLPESGTFNALSTDLGTAYDCEPIAGNWVLSIPIDAVPNDDDICIDPASVCLTVFKAMYNAQTPVITDPIVCSDDEVRMQIAVEQDIILADEDNDGIAGYGVDIANSAAYDPFVFPNPNLLDVVYLADPLQEGGPYGPGGVLTINENALATLNVNEAVLPHNVPLFAVSYTFDDGFVFDGSGCGQKSTPVEFVILNALDAFRSTDYTCHGDDIDGHDQTADVTVAVAGGLPGFDPTALYCISGTGIYQIGSSASDLQAFDFGNIGGCLTTTGEGDFSFVVVEDQPWSITFTDDEGCSVTVEGVFDTPSPAITGLNTHYCEEDPALTIYDASIFEGGVAIPPADFPGFFTDDIGAITDNADGTATFDPFVAGPGQHLVSYFVNGYFEGGALIHTECPNVADQVVNVYPSLDPSFSAPQIVCAGSGDVTLRLNDILFIQQIFADVEADFDAHDVVNENNFFIRWSGPGIDDLNDGADADGDPLTPNTGTGNATFNPDADGTVVSADGETVLASGVGTHTVCVEVGYPSCFANYCRTITVINTASAALTDKTLCGSSTEVGTGQVELTGLFAGSTTNNGGQFALVSALDGAGAAAINQVSVTGDQVVYNTNANLTLTVCVAYGVGDVTVLDVNNDGIINGADIANAGDVAEHVSNNVIRDINNDGSVTFPADNYDANGDGLVNAADQTIITSNSAYAPLDVNGDGSISTADWAGLYDAQAYNTCAPNVNAAGLANLDALALADRVGGTCYSVDEATLSIVDSPMLNFDLPEVVCSDATLNAANYVQLIDSEGNILPGAGNFTSATFAITEYNGSTTGTAAAGSIDAATGVYDPLATTSGLVVIRVTGVIDNPAPNPDCTVFAEEVIRVKLGGTPTLTLQSDTLCAGDGTYWLQVDNANTGFNATYTITAINTETGVALPAAGVGSLTITGALEGANGPAACAGADAADADDADANDLGDNPVFYCLNASNIRQLTPITVTVCVGEGVGQGNGQEGCQECASRNIWVFPAVIADVHPETAAFCLENAVIGDLSNFLDLPADGDAAGSDPGVSTLGGTWQASASSNGTPLGEFQPTVTIGVPDANHPNGLFYSWNGNLLDPGTYTLVYTVGTNVDYNGNGTLDGVASACYDQDFLVITINEAPNSDWNTCPKTLGPIVCEGQGDQGTWNTADPGASTPVVGIAPVVGGANATTDIYGGYDLTALTCEPLIEEQTMTACAEGNAGQTLTASITIPGIPDEALIIDWTVEISYTGDNGTDQGDLDHLTVTAPGGTTIMEFFDNQGPEGTGNGNDHFGTCIPGGAGNGCVPNGADLLDIEDDARFIGTDPTLTMASTDRVGQADLADLETETSELYTAAAYTGLDYNGPDNRCGGRPWVLSVLTNSNNSNICFSVKVRYTTGEFFARIHETTGAATVEFPIPHDGNADGDFNDQQDVAGGVFQTAPGQWVFDATDLEEFTDVEISYRRFSCDESDPDGVPNSGDEEVCHSVNTQLFFVNGSYNGSLADAMVCEDECAYDMTAMISGEYQPGFEANGGDFYVLAPFTSLANGDIFNACGVFGIAEGISAADAADACAIAATDAATAAASAAAADAAFLAWQNAVLNDMHDPAIPTLAAAYLDAYNHCVADKSVAVTSQLVCDNMTAIANTDAKAPSFNATVCYAVGTSPTCGGGVNCATLTIFRNVTADFADNASPHICATGNALVITPAAGTTGYTTALTISGATTTDLLTAGTVTGTTVTFDIPDSWDGLYYITHTTTNGECSNTVVKPIYIVKEAKADLTATTGSYCSDDIALDNGNIHLNQYIASTATEAGYFAFVGGANSGTGTGTLNGSILHVTAAGTFVLEYRVGVEGECYDVSSALTITVTDSPDPSFTAPQTVCAGSTVAITTVTAGGTWSGSAAALLTDNGNGTYTVTNNVAGLFTLTYTVTVNGCTDSWSQDIQVVDSPEASFTPNEISVCIGGGSVNLTDWLDVSSTNGGSFSVAGCPTCVNGNFFLTANAGIGTHTVTYSVGVPPSCNASATLTINVGTQANAHFDAPGTICSGDTWADLTDFFVGGTTVGGTFSVATGGNQSNANAGTINGNAYTAPATGGTVIIKYSVGTGACAASWEEVVLVITPETVVTEGYGFVCESEDDFSIDLTDYIPSGNNINGGTFNVGTVPPVITEIEYDSPNNLQHVEITAAEGTDMSCYALFFYERPGGNTTQPANGKVYGIQALTGTVGANYSSTNSSSSGTGNLEVISLGASDLKTAASGIKYGAIAYDVPFLIKSGPAGIALVNICEAAKFVPSFDLNYDGAVTLRDFDGDGFQGADADFTIGNTPNNTINGHRIEADTLIALSNLLGGGPYTFADINTNNTGTSANQIDAAELAAWVAKFATTPANLKLDQLDHRYNDAVVQFLGYGATKTTTNGGIFSTCDGPAAGMVTSDIGVVDQDGSSRSLQFTNNCWVVPNITDAPLNYDEHIFEGDKDDDTYSPGAFNWGMTEAGADELYYNYIAPSGDILNQGRLCPSLFVTNQVEGKNEIQNMLEEGGIDNEEGYDDDLVFFTCANPTYTLPFNYQLLTGCGSNLAQFNLTVLMDIEEDWSLPKESICENADPLNLTQLIDDTVHYILPTELEGSFTATKTETFAENMKPAQITEIHNQWYDYDGEPTDDHHVTYNYVDDNGTPFNNQDDTYTKWNFTEGIELSAPTGTDLSCYQLVFYGDQDVNPNSPNSSLGVNILYIDSTGLPNETDIDDGEYMQLYGSIDEDEPSTLHPNPNPLGYEVLTVPGFDIDQWGNYPFYGGVNPQQGDFYGTSNPNNAPAQAGLYLDTNGNGVYDAATDTYVDASTFPWERNEHENNCNKPNVGSRWFPIQNMPDKGGVGLLNKCNGELVNFISWGYGAGESLCVEAYEDFSMAGPFEQLTATNIDTIQSDVLGDLRTLQLVSCSELTAMGLNTSGCAACQAGGEGVVWVVVYNGGAATIPMCSGLEAGDVEDFEFSNSIGYFNCWLDEAYPWDTESFNLDLTPLIANCEADLDGIETTGELPNNAIITSHVVEVQIGTGDVNHFQVFQFKVGANNCTTPWDETNNTNHHYCLVGDPDPSQQPFYNDDDAPYYTVTEFCGDCVNSHDNACIKGEYVDLIDYNDPYTTADDGIADGYYDEVYVDGNGEESPQNNCYVGECTSFGKDKYNITDIAEYIFSGNKLVRQDGSLESKTDSCRYLSKALDSFTVKMTVRINWKSCLPVGNFSGTGVSLETDLCGDEAWYQFDPSGLADLVDVDITNNVNNVNAIEADDVTDNLNCLDDDNQSLDGMTHEIRTQQLTILPAASADLNATSFGPICANGGSINLGQFYAAGTSATGTWSGTGVQGNSFNPAGLAPGNYVLTYSVGIGSTCAASSTISIEVNAGAANVMVSAPSTVCATSGSVQLEGTPAGGSFSGANVSATGSFAATTAGAYTVTYTVGSGACAVSSSATINVVAPLQVLNVTTNCNNDQSAYTVSFNVLGGTGTYSVASNFTSAPIPSDQGYSFNVTDLGAGATACNDDVIVSGSSPCAPVCNAFAGTLDLDLPEAFDGVNMLYCPSADLHASTEGNNDANGYSTVFVITDANGTIVAIDNDGNIPTSPLDLAGGADYTIQALNFNASFGTNVPSVGSNISQLEGCYSLSNGTTFEVLPEIVIVANPVCSSELGGWIVEISISGGTPEYDGFGAYTINFTNINTNDGTVQYSNGSATATIADKLNGVPVAFNAGDIISISVSNDGRLCSGGPAIVMIPNVECSGGILAQNDIESTQEGEPINFNIIGNDFGNDIRVLSYGQPQHGTVVIDEYGNVTYVPDAGFTGVDHFTYTIIDANGNTTTATVDITVVGNPNADLVASGTAQCPAADDPDYGVKYDVILAISGGAAPYTISGDASFVVQAGQSIPAIQITDGSPYFFTITDNDGASFTIEGDAVECTKLPIECADFSGEVKSDGNMLKWTSASEINNDYYKLERSVDGVNYTTIQTVKGKGNNSQLFNYNYFDNAPATGMNYYRLVSVDFDGTNHYVCNVLTLTRGELTFSFTNVYPVPVTGVLNVSFTSGIAAVVHADIYDAQGKLLVTKSFDAVKGMNLMQENVSGFAAGAYFINLNNGTEVITTKFIKD